MKLKNIALLAPAVLLAGNVMAGPITASSYDMLNGNTGSYNYWDDSYNGAGNNMLDGASLTGGTGDLTDGIIAAQSWQHVESPLGPQGPYVGWTGIDPTITFEFALGTIINSVTIHVDDSGIGGVGAPLSATVNGDVFAITDPAGTDPFSATFSGNWSGPLALTLQASGSWIFMSEVTFEDTSQSVPEPDALALVVLGLIAGGLVRRKRKHNA
jgi:hypothetical protein